MPINLPLALQVLPWSLMPKGYVLYLISLLWEALLQFAKIDGLNQLNGSLARRITHFKLPKLMQENTLKSVLLI